MFGCEDRAKPGFEECKKLEADGHLSEAASACDRAANAAPDSDTGKLAFSKLLDIRKKLDEILPPKVTLDFCARLRRRIDERVTPAAVAKQGQGAASVVHDHALNVEYECRGAVGQSTSGLWECRWNETLDNYKACDDLETPGKAR